MTTLRTYVGGMAKNDFHYLSPVHPWDLTRFHFILQRLKSIKPEGFKRCGWLDAVTPYFAFCWLIMNKCGFHSMVVSYAFSGNSVVVLGILSCARWSSLDLFSSKGSLGG